MTKQEAILRMMIPQVPFLIQSKAEWEEIDQKIDSCAEIYDRIASAYPEEDDIDVEDDLDDEIGYGGSMEDWDIDEEIRKAKSREFEEFKQPEINIVHGKFDESVTKEESEIIDKYMEKQEQYIPFVETKINSEGSIF